jgi:hypothetical protein
MTVARGDPDRIAVVVDFEEPGHIEVGEVVGHGLDVATQGEGEFIGRGPAAGDAAEGSENLSVEEAEAMGRRGHSVDSGRGREG